jgi:diguanylate cyclase (GGDEF)-like protein
MESLCQQLGLPEVSEKDVIDEDAGMPSRASFLRHLTVITQAVEMGKVNATLALLRVDQYNTITHKHGQQASSALLKQLGQVIRTNLREDDVMGYAEPNRVGVLLLETTKENAKIPLNRIRWMFAANPVEIKGEKIPVTLTASYIGLQGKGTPASLIEQCQRLLRETELNVGNTIIEPTA